MQMQPPYLILSQMNIRKFWVCFFHDTVFRNALMETVDSMYTMTLISAFMSTTGTEELLAPAEGCCWALGVLR